MNTEESLFDAWGSATPPSGDLLPTPEGVYPAKVVKATIKQPGPNEMNSWGKPVKPHVEWQLDLKIDQSGGTDFVKTKVWKKRFLTPEAVWTLKKDFSALSLETPTKMSDLAAALDQVLGKDVMVKIHYRTWDSPDGAKEIQEMDFMGYVDDAEAVATEDDLPF